MITFVPVMCALLLFAQGTEVVHPQPDLDYSVARPVHSLFSQQGVEPGEQKTKKVGSIPLPPKTEVKPVVTVDYYQPAFRDPLELVALAQSLLSDDVKVIVEPKAGRLRIESESKDAVASSIRLLQFLDRRYLEFSVEITYTYMDSLEKLGYYGEFDMVSGGILSGSLERLDVGAKVFTTASEKRQVFLVLEDQSVDVYTGRTQITLKPREVYVTGDQPIVRMETCEQYCGFHMAPQMTPNGPRISLDPFCHLTSGLNEKPGFAGPKVSVPVELGKKVALFALDDPSYPQARRLATALFIWARNKLEREPVLVFEVGIKGLDEIVGRSER